MNSKTIILNIILMLLPLSIVAKASDDALRDSINKAAQADDFITVSLVYATPGDAIYSLQGHSLLRLECPSANLDIMYTFETGEDAKSIIRFFGGKAEAGFVYAPTPVVMADYRSQGRGMKQIRLNLNPHEKQELWKYLDTQMRNHITYRYNYLNTNCTTMLVSAVEQTIYPESIAYTQLPQGLSGEFGAFRTAVGDYARGHEWARLFWNLTLGTYADRDTTLEHLLVPGTLWDAWLKARICDNEGHQRPLVIGKEKVIQTTTYICHPALVSPTMFFAILLILAVVSLLSCKKRQGEWLGRLLDILIMATVTIVGLWELYLSPLFGTICSDWNYLMPVFSPLPLIIWLIGRKKHWMYYAYIVFAVVPLIYALFSFVIPQMRFMPCMPLIMLTISVRAGANALEKARQQKPQAPSAKKKK